MSSLGAGTVVIVPAALIVGALVVTVGGVILVAEGTAEAVAWAGRQLTVNYNNRLASHRRVAEEAMKAQQQNLQAQSAYVQGIVRQMFAERAHLPTGGQNADQEQAEVQALIAQALSQARNAQTLSPADAQTRDAATQLRLLRLRLESEISTATKGGLPDSVINQARAALGGDGSTINGALQAIADAWANITSTEAIRAHDEAEARSLLVQARAQLDAARALVQQRGSAAFEPIQLQRLDVLDRDVNVDQGRLTSDPRLALENGRKHLTAVSGLLTTMLTASSGDQDATLHRRAAITGSLEALATMANELNVNHILADTNAADDFARRVAALRRQVGGATEAQLASLELACEDIKEAIFRAVNTREQQAVGGVIAETLVEQGFHDLLKAGAPEVVPVGEGAFRVTGLRNDAPVGAGNDDKLVTFTLLPDGRIDYDFGGYVGAACQKDANAIFTALRRKGIVILDTPWMQTHDMNTATVQQLMAADLPQINVTKRQALIAERVKLALERMGYRSDEIVETSYGGVRQLDARNGDLGYYHVALDAMGSQTVSRGPLDVTADMNDTIAQAAGLPVATPAPTPAAPAPRATQTWREQEEVEEEKPTAPMGGNRTPLSQ